MCNEPTKYYKTVIHVTVLSDHPYTWDTLDDIEYDITEGGCSGITDTVSSEEVSREEMVTFLLEQGSDPSFLVEDYDE